MSIVTIHQPEFLSYYGFYAKAKVADKLVILDDTQYRKNYFQNRNQIPINGKMAWLTLPVMHDSDTLIKDVVFNGRLIEQAIHKLTSSITNTYRKYPYFSEFYTTELQSLFHMTHLTLSEYNLGLIKYILSYLDIKCEVIKSSTLALPGISTDHIVNICNHLNALEYIAGKSGRDYLELEKFNGIKVKYCDVKTTYTQRGITEFIPYASVIDGIFNHGKNFYTMLKCDLNED